MLNQSTQCARDLDTIEGLNIEVSYLKAQLGIFADHFESEGCEFDKVTYSNFIYSIIAGVERLESNINKITTGGAQ